MSNAVEKIVDTYVQLNDHQALEDLRTYRQRLAVHLKARSTLDFSLLTGQIDAEIAVIEAGLDRLTELSAHERHAENGQRAYVRRAPDSFAEARPHSLSPLVKPHQRAP